jgi:hypothetical protein
MKVFLVLALSALAAKPVPIKVQASLNKAGGPNYANLGVPFKSPSISSMEILSLTPNFPNVANALADIQPMTAEAGENKVSPLAQAETAALPENATLAFDGFAEADTREEPKTGIFARFSKSLPVAQVDSPAPLGLQGLKRRGERWGQNGRRLRRLGQGTIGSIDIHPTRPGLIVKTIDPNLDQLIFGASVPEAKEADFLAAEVLAKAGVGPQVLGTALVDGRHVSVRERIFGETMRDLVWDKKFGLAEEALVLDMVKRMAAANVLVGDMKPENIMIGHTEKDPTLRAWFVDGGLVEEMPEGLDQAARERKILDYLNVVSVRQDMNSGQMILAYRTLRQYLQEPRDRREMPRWRYILKSIAEAYMRGGGGGMIPK